MSFSGGWFPRWRPLGGAVWALNEEGQLALQYQINFQQTRLADNEAAQAQHGRLLYKAMGSTEGMLVAAAFGPGRGRRGGQPDRFPPRAGPLADRPGSGGRGRSVAAERHRTGRAARLSALPAADVRAGRRLPQEPATAALLRPPGALWSRLEDFTRTVHASLEPLETAYTIANEGRRLIECDRISVAIRKGNRCVIEAVSGQDVFDKRSNTIRLLGRLASAVVASGRGDLVYGRHPRHGPASRRGRAGVRRRVALEDGGRAALAASAAGRGRRSGEAAGAAAGHRRPDRRADRGQPPGAGDGAAGGRGLPAQLHGAGQRDGASEPVSHARLAGAGQEPAGSSAPAPCPRRVSIGRPWCWPWWWRCAVWPADFQVQSKGTLGAGRSAGTCLPASTASWSTCPSQHGDVVAGGETAGPPPQHRRRRGADPGRGAARSISQRADRLLAADAAERAAAPRRRARPRSPANWPRSEEKLVNLNAQRRFCQKTDRRTGGPQPDPRPGGHLGPEQPPQPAAGAARADAAAGGRPRRPLATRTPHARGTHGLHRLGPAQTWTRART